MKCLRMSEVMLELYLKKIKIYKSEKMGRYISLKCHAMVFSVTC